MSGAATTGPDVTEDLLLGGRVRLRQPRCSGLRAGIDPVLLAAAVPARPGETVLEAGCGSGAAFLCLAARVPGLSVRAVERDPVLAALATENAAANGLGPDRAQVVAGDVHDRGASLARSLGGGAAHAFANPPWWPGGTPPPEARRRAATHADAEAPGLESWVGFLATALAPGGSLTLILPAALFDRGVAALGAGGIGAVRLFPLWPRIGRAAKRVLLQGRLGRRGPARVEAGLVLHPTGTAGGGGGFTPEAEAVLRDAAALPWAVSG